MVDLSEIQAAYYMVAATGVLVAAFYYVYNMRISQRNSALALKAQEQNLETRQAQLYMQLYQNTMSNEFLDSGYKNFRMELKSAEDYNRMMNDPDKYRNFFIQAMWLEGQGVLVREGLIDIRLVSLLSSGLITWWWDYYGGMVLKVREELGFHRFMIEAEYLAKMVREYGLGHPELGIVPIPNVATQPT